MDAEAAAYEHRPHVDDDERPIVVGSRSNVAKPHTGWQGPFACQNASDPREAVHHPSDGSTDIASFRPGLTISLRASGIPDRRFAYLDEAVDWRLRDCEATAVGGHDASIAQDPVAVDEAWISHLRLARLRAEHRPIQLPCFAGSYDLVCALRNIPCRSDARSAPVKRHHQALATRKLTPLSINGTALTGSSTLCPRCRSPTNKKARWAKGG